MNNATVRAREPAEENRIAAWTAQILRGEMDAVRASFAANGTGGPTLIWCPAVEDLSPPPLKFLLGHWQRLKGEHRYPLASLIDPLEMRPALGYITLLAPIDGGRDFRFRLFGTVIAAACEFDMTGDMLSSLPLRVHVAEYELALHRAALARGEPVYTWHIPPSSASSAIWHRLVLPFGNERGEIVRLMTGIVPVPRAERLD